MANKPIDEAKSSEPTSFLDRLRASFKGAADWLVRILGLSGMVPPAR